MDFIRMNCPMAVLTEETKTSDASKLPSAAFILQSPFGFYPNEIENGLRQENQKNTSAPIF